MENISTPEDYIEAMLARVKKDYIQKTYSIQTWKDHVDFLEQFARKSGRLLKVGTPDYKVDFYIPTKFRGWVGYIEGLMQDYSNLILQEWVKTDL